MAKKLVRTSSLHVIWGKDRYEGIRCKAGLMEQDFASGDISKDYRDARNWGKELSIFVVDGASIRDLLRKGEYIFIDGTIKELTFEEKEK